MLAAGITFLAGPTGDLRQGALGMVAESGETWSFAFETVGELEYFCTPHPWMRAKVIVVA